MNRGAVQRAIEFGLAVGAHIAESSVFARKNYFYPDLPKGYQISQFEIPVVQGGSVEFFLDGQKKSVRLVRAHLEEDAGKSLHEDSTLGSASGVRGGLTITHGSHPAIRTEPCAECSPGFTGPRHGAIAGALHKSRHRFRRWIVPHPEHTVSRRVEVRNDQAFLPHQGPAAHQIPRNA